MYNREMNNTQEMKTMKLSEMIHGVDYREKSAFPIPKSDNYQYVSTPEAMAEFIAVYGDHDVIIKTNTNWFYEFSIPDFDASRKIYCAAKQADCDRWGCE